MLHLLTGDLEVFFFFLTGLLVQIALHTEQSYCRW